MIYLILFFITSILFYAAQQLKDTSKVAFYVLSYLAIFLLALVAGCRDNTIGTDVLFYEVDVFRSASMSTAPITEAFRNFYWIEPFFFTLNYIASLFGNLGTALFLIMFVQTLFVFYGMKFYMNRAPLWMLMLAYDFIYYNLSLNLMRQGIAIAFLLFSYQYVEKRNFTMLLIMAILVFFWHKSSAVAFLILFGIYFIYGCSEKIQKKLFFVLIPACILSIASLAVIMESLIEIIPIMNKYSAYTVSNGKGGGFDSGLSTIGIGARLLMASLVAYMYLNKAATSRQFYIFIIIFMMDLSSMFLGLYTVYATRFAYYFEILEIPLLFEILHSNKIKKNTQIILSNMMLLCFSFMSLWINIHNGSNETYPYILRVFNIILY